MSLDAQLQRLNPVLRGWAYFYRHAWGAKRVFSSLDHYVWWTVLRWLRKKHDHVAVRRITAMYRRGRTSGIWEQGETCLFKMTSVPVEQFKLGWLKPPDFAAPSRESPVHNDRCTPGSEGGARKPTR